MIRESFGSVGIVGGGNQVATGADDFILRQGELHIEGAEVREEFRVFMKLVAIPDTFPPDTDFRKPLTDHKKVANVAGASDNFGHLIFKGDFELHIGTRSDGLRELQLDDCVVEGVVVIGMDEFDLIGEIAHTSHFQVSNVNRAEVLGLPFVIGIIPATLGYERGLRLEGVEIEVEGKNRLRLAGEIAVRERFGGRDGVFFRVELGVNNVGNDAR